MKTTTYTADQMILSDGEVYIIDRNKRAYEARTKEFRLRDGNTYRFDEKEDMGFAIIACSAYVPGCHQLDRNRFVRGVDIDALASDYAERNCSAYTNDYYGFTAGYNANKNEFTLDELKQAWRGAYELSESFYQVIKRLRPLSLPASIEVDEMFNVINVKWE